MTEPVWHALTVTPDRGRLRAGCECGWKALGLDKTRSAAEQAWYAHMYAKGYRTRQAIQEAAAA